MKNYLLSIQYNGSNFYGWNLQPEKSTIVSELTKAIKKIYKGKIEIRGSGRTDRGVHAIAQQASVILGFNIKPNKLKQILNYHLDDDIRITKIVEKDLDFHARYDAKDKTYKYRIINSKNISVFKNNFVWFVDGNINISRMKRVTKDLIGEKDFKSFASISKKENIKTIKTITKIIITKKDNEIIFKISGKGFMNHMVRKIVATLVAIGQCEEDTNYIKKTLKAKTSSSVNYKAPPQGLYLYKVNY